MWKRGNITKKGRWFYTVSWSKLWGGWFIIPSIQIYFCAQKKPREWREFTTAFRFVFLGFDFCIHKHW